MERLDETHSSVNDIFAGLVLGNISLCLTIFPHFISIQRTQMALTEWKKNSKGQAIQCTLYVYSIHHTKKQRIKHKEWNKKTREKQTNLNTNQGKEGKKQAKCLWIKRHIACMTSNPKRKFRMHPWFIIQFALATHTTQESAREQINRTWWLLPCKNMFDIFILSPEYMVIRRLWALRMLCTHVLTLFTIPLSFSLFLSLSPLVSFYPFSFSWSLSGSLFLSLRIDFIWIVGFQYKISIVSPHSWHSV